MGENMEKLDFVNVSGAEISKAEIQAYVDRGRCKNPTNKLVGIDIAIDGDEAEISYTYDDRPFERIRRITGYLVGTLDRFNNGKRAEVEDRVTHSIQDDCEDCFV